MRNGSMCCLASICVLLSPWAGGVRGQDANPDAVIDAIRARFATTVLTDGIRAVNLEPGDGARAVAAMAAAGVAIE